MWDPLAAPVAIKPHPGGFVASLGRAGRIRAVNDLEIIFTKLKQPVA
jgi:hypothetical protein